ncbi:uncharacterized protein M421DRAFT_418804, partial [Didymella exigua CBS 183.55]
MHYAYTFINAELALNSCFTPPIDHRWLSYNSILCANTGASLAEREQSLQTIMEAL